MTPNKWQLKAAVTGKVTSGSDWDGKSLGEIYLTLRKQHTTHRSALDIVGSIKANRLHAMTDCGIPHLSKDQALLWLLETRIAPYEALRRVYGAKIPQWASNAVDAAWSKLNAEHRQALEDVRMAG